MEEKKQIKISLGIFIIFLIIIILFIVGAGLVGFMLGSKSQSNNVTQSGGTSNDVGNIPDDDNENKNSNTSNSNSSKNEENKNTNSSKNRNKKNKDYELEDLVEDADYISEDFEDVSYFSETLEKEYSLEDVKLPKVIFEGESADKVNKEIKKLYSDIEKDFEEEYNGEQIGYTISNYEASVNDNILSIIIATEIGGTDSPFTKYYSYNIDLENDKILECDEIFEFLEFDEDDIDEKIEEVINNNDIYDNLDEDDIEEYAEKTIKEYKKQKDSKKLNCYLDSDKNLNIVVKILAPVGGEEFERLYTIK